jgi:uncharacterized glyoxalase superfamily protein PhnB
MGTPVIPTLRYEDARAAVEFLCTAFGFEKHAVYEDDAGDIVHAQLRLGDGMIMLGPWHDDEFGTLQTTTRRSGGLPTQSAYIIVDDPDAHCERAVAAGARVVYGPQDEDYGGRGYSCLDPEDNLWNFGSYDPWA